MSLRLLITLLAGVVVYGGPSNDDFADAQRLVGSDLFFLQDTYRATVEPGEPAHELSPISGIEGPVVETVWYRWTAPSSGMLHLKAENPAWYSSTYFASSLYRGSVLTNLEARPRIEWPGRASYVWPVTEGETYSLAVGVQQSVPELLPLTNRLAVVTPASNFEFATRPVLATNQLTGAFQFGPGNDDAPPLAGELLWWRFPENSVSGTERLMIYCSTPGEWLVYEGDRVEDLRLVERGATHTAPDVVEVYFPVEAGSRYSLAFRPLGTTRQGVFLLYSFFTRLRISVAGEAVESGADLVLNLEVPDDAPAGATLRLGRGTPFSNFPNFLGSWTQPFPTNFVVPHIEAGTNDFVLSLHRSSAQITEMAGLRVMVPHRNDDFAKALPVTGYEPVLSVDLRGATVEAGEPALPNGGNKTVWFSWVAPESGRLVTRDWRIEVFSGNSLETLAPVEKASGLPEWDHAYVVEDGVTYYLRAIGGEWWTLNDRQVWLVPFSARPVNDNFGSAITLTGTNLVRTSSVYGATVQTNEPINASTGTVWYRWTSPGRGSVVIYGNGIGQLETFAGAALGALEYWNQNEGVHAGQVLYMRHAGSGLETNQLTLTLQYWPSPANDDFGAAIQLVGRSGSVEANFAGASNEPGEPMGLNGFVPPPAVWYRWTAPEEGYLYIEPRVQVRLFRNAGALTEVQSAVSSAGVFPVNPGQTYYVRFATGISTTLRYEWLPLEVPNDLIENATVLSGTDIQFTARTFQATASADEPTNVLRSVWFRWQAPTNGTVQISAQGIFNSSYFPHRLVVLNEDGTTEVGSSGLPGTFSFPVEGGSNYLFMVGVYSNGGSIFLPGWFPDWQHSQGTVVNCSLLFATYKLASPLPDQTFTTNDVVEARLSEPVEGIDPPFTKVTFYVPHPISGPDLAIESTNGVVVLTNRVGNTRISASVHLENGRTFSLGPVHYRVVDGGLPHDDFAGRELLVGRDVRRPITSAEIFGATFEPGEPKTSGAAPALWFRWVAPANGLASIGPVTSESWPLVIRAWQGGPYASNLLRPPLEGGRIIVIPWPPIVADNVQVFRGTTLTNLELVLGLTNSQRAFVAEAGVEYAIRFPALYNAKALLLHLTTVEVIEPASDDGKARGEPVAIELTSTERPEEIAGLDVVVGTNVVASFASAPFRTTLTDLVPGEHAWRSVLRLYSGETVTNEHPAIRVYPPNVTAERAEMVTTNFAFDVRGFRDPGVSRGRIDGPALYYRMQPSTNLAVFTKEAELTVFSTITGETVAPFAFVWGPNTNSTSLQRPVYELRADGDYLLVVSNLFQEDGLVQFLVRPGNDAIENAEVISGLRATIPLMRNVLAREENEPSTYANVWYRWQSPGAGYILLSHYASVFAEGNFTNQIEPISEAIPSYFYPVEAGGNYYLGFEHTLAEVAGSSIEFRFVPRATNDRVQNASRLRGTDIDLSFDFFGLTTEPVEVDHGSTNAIGSLWWRWLSPADGKLALSLEAEAPGVLTRVHLYVRENGTNWIRVPEEVSRSARWHSVAVGQEYYIAVERVANDPWGWNRWQLVPMNLRLRMRVIPMNDRFANAQWIASDVVVRGNTHLASREEGESAHGGLPAAQSVWYKWQANRDGLAYLKYAGFDTNNWGAATRTLSVYSGSSVTTLTPRRMQISQSPWLGLSFEVTAGEEYYIAVDGRGGAEDFALLLETESVPLEIFAPRMTVTGIEFDLPAVRNTPVTVEQSVDLAAWTAVYIFPPDHPGPFVVPFDTFSGIFNPAVPNLPHRFYRVRINGIAPAE